ncbi:MAG: BTAD domain-containing putative transcriptional regulator [Fimbriimonadales bacterium]
MRTEPRWYFQLFGGFEARCGSVWVHRLRTAKTTALLGYMASHPPHRFMRSALCELFWEDMEPERARNNLSVSLNAIRHGLHLNESDDALLTSDAHSVALNPDLFVVDVLEFEEALTLAAHTSDPSAQYQHYAHAVSLYRGEFMAGFYEPWIIDRSAQLQLKYIHALRQLIDLDLQRGERMQAIEWLQRLMSEQPYDPDLLYELTILYLDEGLTDTARQMCLAWRARYEREQRRAIPDKARAALMHCQQSARIRKGEQRQLTPRRLDKPELIASPPVAPAPEYPAESTIPIPSAPLFGREDELEALLRLLQSPDTRCVTLLGLGGVGKTRLALEVAHRWTQQGADTVYWVPLASLTHAEQIAEGILRALSVEVSSEPHAQLLYHLRQRESLLLVLDNLEHLLPDAAPLLARLLQEAPACRLLITSRIPIDIDGELRFTLAPLPCEDAAHSPAVRLFVHRARQVAHDFRMTEANLPVIAALCQRLDGVPLAIELAASRVNVLSPRQMLESIANRLQWLKTNRVDIPSRHREMRSVLDVACATLPPLAQTLLRQLAITQGDWTLSTLHAIFYPKAPLEPIAEALELLINAGLATRTTNSDIPRFRLLEVVREYAQTLQSPDEQCAWMQAVSAWVCTQAATRHAQCYTEQLFEWLAFWDDHREMLLETLVYLREQGRAESRLQLFIHLERYLALRPFTGWMREQLTHAVQTPDTSPDLHCRGLCLLARLFFSLEEFEQAFHWARQAHALAESPDAPVDDETRGWTLYWMVQIAFALRDMDTVNAHWERLWAYYPCPHYPQLHLAIHYLAGYLLPDRHTAEWRAQAVLFAHQQGDPLMLLDAIDALLEPLYFSGAYDRARVYLAEAESIARRLGAPMRLLTILYKRAYIDIQQGAFDSAEQLIANLDTLNAQVGRHAESIHWLRGLLYRTQGRYADALQAALQLTARREIAHRPHEAAIAWELAATAALGLGDLVAARRYAEHALRQRALQEDTYRLHFSKTIAYGVCGLASPDADAIRGLQECLRFWQTTQMTPWQANTLYYLACAYNTLGDLPSAQNALDEAIRLNIEMGRLPALEQCRALAAQIAAQISPENPRIRT